MTADIWRRLRAPFTALAFVVIAALASATPALADAPAGPKPPIEVRVVIVTTWEVERGEKDIIGELHNWRVKWPMATQIPFPVGARALQYDPQTHVLAILTGEATARAAASIMALGLDPRFDLSHAYWIVAGTAGVDPNVASAGSAAWSRWVIDGDLSQELDARDIPPDWSTGIVPNGRVRPFEQPAPPGDTDAGHVVYALNRDLVDWAYNRTKGIKLPDNPNLARLRSAYTGPGAQPPFVLEGEGLMSARFWYGDHLTAWAEQWVPYYTGGQGVFAMSAEEDTGILQALTFLSQDHRVRLDRVLVLRAASDYAVAPPGMTGAAFLAKEASGGLPANPEALDALYAVAAPVARALEEDWEHTKDMTPGGE
jgi:purine nucleoside permease